MKRFREQKFLGRITGPVTFRPLLSALWAILLVVTACGSGNDNTPPPKGTVSGRLIVPPNHVLEEEPNETIGQAQPVEESWLVIGIASESDPGFPLPGFPGEKAEDLYRVVASGPMQVTLTTAEDNVVANDLDLILMDPFGDVLDVSEGFVFTEVIDTTGAGEFLVGVRAFQGSSAYVLSFSRLVPLHAEAGGILPAGAEFVPGEILVRFRSEEARADAQVRAFASRFGLETKRSLPGGVSLLSLSLAARDPWNEAGKEKLLRRQSEPTDPKAMTLDRIRSLRKDRAVAYAEPNFIRRPLISPNDPLFALQWHYALINLPEAWEMTTGSEDITVAVIDSGVLSGHPDLAARLTDGYDFIRDLDNAKDGDGIDPDPEDMGDDPEGENSSFHGTHVAGTLGAATNNNRGVAGVTWQTRIMPLRALGVEGGTDLDVAQAIRYAAGLSNDSGTVPEEPARIVNMSFGGPGFGQTLEDAILAARQQGAILVAAAGNESTRLAYYPAASQGVISVSAVDLNLRKAPYSNFGPTVDVAAPGGDTSAYLTPDEYPDGVLSTFGNDEGEYLYGFYQGTSMAAPHVSGVFALMLAANPNLTPEDIDQLLAGTHPDTTIRITQDLGQPGRDEIYGEGLIDAAQAVVAAQAIPGGGGTAPFGSILAVSTNLLNFENFLDRLSFKVTNAGIGTLQVTGITDSAPWLTVSPTSGTAPITVEAIVDRAGLVDGDRTATILLATDATQGPQTASIVVEMHVGGKTTGSVGEVFVLVLDDRSSETVAQAETDASQGYAFTTPPVSPGTYQIVAGTDLDDDGLICDIEDACGFSPEPVTIVSGQDTPAIDFVVSTIALPQSLSSASPQPTKTPFPRIR